MSKKQTLPIAVHDHFRKANVLHKYVQTSLGEATKHALETGQELLVAKSAIPHGRWEDECERLFDGSTRTARFYMTFAKDFTKLKSAEKSAILMLEGTLDGAAKAARAAAKPSTPAKPTPPRTEPDDGEDGRTDSDGTEPQEQTTAPPRNGTDKPVDYGKCPNCGGTEFDEDGDCAKCFHPCGEESEATTQQPSKGKSGRESESAAKLVDQLTKQHIGHVARGLTRIAVANGGEGAQFNLADDGLNQLIKALQKMREGQR